MLLCSTGEIVENKSLLPYEILILGTDLPKEIRKEVISLVSSEAFFTEYGFATESPTSELYRSDGYWRGPIWAPSTMFMIDGLNKCGEKALAKEAAKRFMKLLLYKFYYYKKGDGYGVRNQKKQI